MRPVKSRIPVASFLCVRKLFSAQFGAVLQVIHSQLHPRTVDFRFRDAAPKTSDAFGVIAIENNRSSCIEPACSLPRSCKPRSSFSQALHNFPIAPLPISFRSQTSIMPIDSETSSELLQVIQHPRQALYRSDMRKSQIGSIEERRIHDMQWQLKESLR